MEDFNAKVQVWWGKRAIECWMKGVMARPLMQHLDQVW